MKHNTHTENHYDIRPLVIDAREYEPKEGGSPTEHQHVVVLWDGGELWLDMSTFDDHNCVDIRQFNSVGEMKGQGYFTIVNGMRGRQDQILEDTSGTPVTGRKWNGGYVATLLTDKDGEEAAAKLPSQGNG